MISDCFINSGISALALLLIPDVDAARCCKVNPAHPLMPETAA
jgi:hypothetical protein